MVIIWLFWKTIKPSLYDIILGTSIVYISHSTFIICNQRSGNTRNLLICFGSRAIFSFTLEKHLVFSIIGLDFVTMIGTNDARPQQKTTVNNFGRAMYYHEISIGRRAFDNNSSNVSYQVQFNTSVNVLIGVTWV